MTKKLNDIIGNTKKSTLASSVNEAIEEVDDYSDLLEGLVYDDGGPGHRAPMGKMSDNADAMKYWKEHNNNHFILQHFHKHGTTMEKIQAAKELPKAESKMKFWQSHPRFDRKEADKHTAEMKKHWSTVKEDVDLSEVHHVMVTYSHSDENTTTTMGGATIPHNRKMIVKVPGATSKKDAINKAGVHMSKGRFTVHSLEHMHERAMNHRDRIEPHFGPAAPKPDKDHLGRIEPHFGPARTKTASGRIEPHFDTSYAAPKASSNSPAAANHSAPEASHSEPGKKHYLVINKDNSVSHTEPGKQPVKLIGAMTHKSSVHGAVLQAVRKITALGHQVHVIDAAKTYGAYAKKVSKTSSSFPAHTFTEETAWDSDTRKEREVDHYKIVHKDGSVVGKANTKKGAQRSLDRHDNNYGSYAHRIKTVFKEDVDMTETTKFAPKKLKDIVLKPERKTNEYDGNTPDERKIVAKIRDNTVVIPDRNGNGDDVFKGSKLKRTEKPVNPGDDEKSYDAWNKAFSEEVLHEAVDGIGGHHYYTFHATHKDKPSTVTGEAIGHSMEHAKRRVHHNIEYDSGQDPTHFHVTITRHHTVYDHNNNRIGHVKGETFERKPGQSWDLKDRKDIENHRDK